MLTTEEKFKMLATNAEAPARMSVDEKVAASMAIMEYTRSSAEFEAASTRFNEACSMVRSALGKNAIFVAKVDSTSYLVVTNGDGDFDINPIQVI